MLRIVDRVPLNTQVDVLYVPALGLAHTGHGLTAMNEACMQRAISLAPQAKRIVVGGSYFGEMMERELALRYALLRAGGIPLERYHGIRGVDDTLDELRHLAQELEMFKAQSVLFVSEEYHMPRLMRWARRLLKGTMLYHVSVPAPRYERTWEPITLKSLRSGTKAAWVTWNLFFNLTTPLLIEVEAQKPRS